MRVLFLSRWFPYPADNGSRIRIFNLIKALGARWEVDLVSFASEAVRDEQQAEMRRYCRTVDVVPYRAYHPEGWRARLAVFSPRPRYVVAVESAEMRARLAEVSRRPVYDAVIASELDMLPYGAEFPAPVRIAEELQLAVFHDQVMRADSAARKARSGLMWWKMARYVAGLLRHYHGVTVASSAEQGLLRSVAAPDTPVSVVPNGVDVAACSADFGPPEPDTLVYSGALTYQANFDAVDFFLREIFPRIQARRPGTRFYVTGKTEPALVDRLPQLPNVVFTGYVADVRPHVARSWVSVVPLRLGGGTRLKVLEALALGTAVVSTTKGVQGLDLSAGEDVLVADDPAAFAAAVVRILENRTLRSRLSARGRSVAARYDWPGIGERLTHFVETLRAVAAPGAVGIEGS